MEYCIIASKDFALGLFRWLGGKSKGIERVWGFRDLGYRDLVVRVYGFGFRWVQGFGFRV